MTLTDPHFPSIHLRPQQNWVNDPNGLVFYDGWYHVFFQYNPHSARHANMHWGHWRSRDLLDWELLPTALTPTPGGADADGVWSGSAIVDGDDLVLFYAAKRDDRWWQPVAIARSKDGIAFTKQPDLAVDLPPDCTTMFRDPYVWRGADRWRMLVGAALEDGRAAAIQYESDDLTDWRLLGPYLALPPQPLGSGRDTAAGWECVQLAPLDDAYAALLFSAWDPAAGAVAAGIHFGRDNGACFDTVTLTAFDHGPDAYAPALMRTPDGRWLVWAWIWEARDEERVGAPSDWTDNVGWAGMLSLPRELSATATGVRQRVASEIEQLRTTQRVCTTRSLTTGNALTPLGVISRTTDIVAIFERSGDGHAASGIRVSTSHDDTEQLDIYLDPHTGDIVLDRSNASLDNRAKRGTWRIPAQAHPGATTEVRIVLDHSVAEVFSDTGEVLTARFYPVDQSPWHLHGLAIGTGQVDLTVRSWDLETIGKSRVLVDRDPKLGDSRA